MPFAFQLPSSIYFLSSISVAQDIEAAGAYRSKQRLPAVTWRDPATDAVLVRSSQPLVGVFHKNSKADQKLLDLYRQRGRASSSNPASFIVLDARSEIAARANDLKGGGRYTLGRRGGRG